jgi:hypothetical protein
MALVLGSPAWLKSHQIVDPGVSLSLSVFLSLSLYLFVSQLSIPPSCSAS